MPSFALYGSDTDCALIVMPRSRSIGLLSRTCASISRAVRPPQSWMMRSASVDLPWSTWAMIEKLRMNCMKGARRVVPGANTALSHAVGRARARGSARFALRRDRHELRAAAAAHQQHHGALFTGA